MYRGLQDYGQGFRDLERDWGPETHTDINRTMGRVPITNRMRNAWINCH